jgi:GNAT superfamily N-acetyltransferase
MRCFAPMSLKENRLTSRVCRRLTRNTGALFVDPEHEGQGHGRRLHDAMVEWLWSQGARQLWLTTEAGTRAQRFYESAGWRFADKAGNGELRDELTRIPQEG